MKRFLYRHQESITFQRCVRSGLKGFAAITILSAINLLSDDSLVVAPFGASCILVMTFPKNELSQPINVIGGYLIASIVGLTFLHFLSNEWWVVGLMLGTTISLMAWTRTTHAPAGAIPLILYFSQDPVDFNFILFPILSGSILIVIIATLLHRIPPAREYPRKLP